MKTSIILLLALLCIATFSQGNNCPSFHAGDLLQSGKNSLIRSNSGSQYTFEAPISFSVPNSGFEFAVTTSTIGNYSPSSGFNYQITAQKKSNSNFLQMTLIASSSGWSSIQVSWFASARSDFSVGNVQYPLAQWTKGSADTYTLSQQISKNLPSVNYKVAVFISGFSTSAKQFQISINQKNFDQKTKKLTVVFYSNAVPQAASITISYIIYPETHSALQLSYQVKPQGDTGAYQLSGPISFANSVVQYNEFRIANRFLACSGSECSNTCVLREECLRLDGNAYEGQCVFCGQGIVFEFGTCTRRCGANQVYLNRVCICNSGYVRQGKDCVKSGPSCAQNQILYNDQCRTCPSGATVSQNTCACPNGQSYDAQNNKCNSNCGVNQVSSGNTCVCAKNFYRYNNACRQCPSGSTINNAQTGCICNVNGQTFDLVNNRCNSVQCPANQVYSGNRCVCANNFVLYNNVCRQCPSNSKAESNQNTCVCQDGFTFDAAKNTCVSRCPNSQTWSNNRCVCISGYSLYNGACRQCPKSSQPSANQSTCVCSSKNARYSSETNLCIECGANSQLNSAKTGCVCNSGFVLSNGSCVPILTCGLNQNAVNNQCQCKFGFIRVGPLCVDACGINQYYTTTGCLCKEGHVKISGVCRPCPSGSLANPAKTSCLCVDGKQYFVPSKNVCENCPVNSFPNDSDTDCSCQPGFTKVNSQCTSNCPTGSSPDSKGTCICSGGKVLFGNQCMTPVTCPDRSTFNTSTSTCVCNNRSQNIIDGACKGCGSNSVWSQNQCVCSTGFFSIAGVCRTCDSRTSYNGTDCTCRLGYFGNRDLCTPCHKSCSQCSGPEANQCLACSDVSLVLQDGFCSKNSPCDFGFFLDNGQCSKCLDNCIECQSIFECKTCALGYKTLSQSLSGQKIVSCEEICGDGIKYEHQCDDGNKVNGDGCSSTCQEEQGWTCSGGSSNAPSKCKKFIPDQVQLSSKGAVNLGSSVVMSVRASYLPSCISENECSRCFKAITANVVNANVPILVTINYVPFSQFQFYVKFDFQGLFVTSIFKVVIRLNQQFKGCVSEEDYNEQLEVTVDPAFLAKSDTVQTLSFDDTIVIPDDVKNYLGN